MTTKPDETGLAGAVQLNAALHAAFLLHEVSTQMIEENDIGALYEKVMDAAVAIMESDFASMQVYNAERQELKLLGYRGFLPKAVAFWDVVTVASRSTCGLALTTGSRVVESDIDTSEFMAGTDDLAMYLENDIHACQTTPLRSRTGEVIGMISTHWSVPHQPSEMSLRLLDILARQAADLIEQRNAELEREELLARLEEQQRLVRALSTPVLRVGDQVLLLPLIGLFDEARTGLVSLELLKAIRDERARVVVLDLKGVAEMTLPVADWLARMVSAARIIGAHVIVTGVSTSVAQTLVSLGTQMRSVSVAGDLQAGLEMARRERASKTPVSVS